MDSRVVSRGQSKTVPAHLDWVGRPVGLRSNFGATVNNENKQVSSIRLGEFAEVDNINTDANLDI